ncbi:MAG: hypothetical protein JWR90_3452 [Marmoricola sp.]|jgi:hypothetical protein|nr:hypothetical protein [Marmoricola sp.]
MSDSDTDTDNDSTTDEGEDLLENGVDTDERAGRSLGIDPKAEPDEDTKNEIEEERDKRLDPDNRPENAEVDNTPRDFDVERGMFTDSEEYDDSEPAPFADPEDPNSDASTSEADEPESKDADGGDAEVADQDEDKDS